jgi:hypothetical protein
MDEKDPIATRINRLPKYVVSTKLETRDRHNSVLIKDNVLDEITKLKAAHGDELQVHGSGLWAGRRQEESPAF